MIKVFRPPEPFPSIYDLEYACPWVFLAGTIDNGNSHDWQADAIAHLSNKVSRDIVLLNPRRKDWDSTWKQAIENKQFVEQVNWELDALENCTIAFFYFAPGSQSPISLMELGLMAERHQYTIVCAPPGYWKYANVQIVAERYGADFVDNFEDALRLLQVAVQDAYEY